MGGHTEYIKYKDGSQEVSVYPQIAWNVSKLYEDVDGDNLVDKIKLNSSWFKNYRLNKILTREYNLETHEAEFDKADRELKEQIRKAEK